MTTDRDFDRIARAWLDLLPEEAPDRAVAAVLQAVETTPQVRRPIRWLTWRSTSMNRLPIALGAAAVVVVAGTLALSRAGTPPSVGSSPSPIATSSPGASSPSASSSAATGSVPAALQAFWMGGHRDLVAPAAGSLLSFDQSTFYLAQSAGSTARQLPSTASAVGNGRIRLESSVAANTCAKGDVGTYAWSLSPSGRILTVTAEQDACPTRAAAVAGTWWLMDCPTTDDNCLGAVDAGTYKSQFISPRLDPGGTWSPIFGALSYTVPDGWANSADWPGSFDLVPATELPPIAEADRTRMIGLLTQPSAMSQERPCSDEPVPGIGRGVDDLVSWLGTVPGLVTGPSTAVTIDGYRAKWLDVRLDPAWKTACPPDEPRPVIAFLNPGVAVASVSRERLYLVDLGDGDVVSIVIWAADQATFDASIAETRQIVESFRFE